MEFEVNNLFVLSTKLAHVRDYSDLLDRTVNLNVVRKTSTVPQTLMRILFRSKRRENYVYSSPSQSGNKA
jgi:hypothetical protein